MMVCFMRCKTALMASDGLTVARLASDFKPHQWEIVMRHPVSVKSRLCCRWLSGRRKSVLVQPSATHWRPWYPGLLQLKIKTCLPKQPLLLKTTRLQLELKICTANCCGADDRGTEGRQGVILSLRKPQGLDTTCRQRLRALQRQVVAVLMLSPTPDDSKPGLLSPLFLRISACRQITSRRTLDEDLGGLTSAH